MPVAKKTTVKKNKGMDAAELKIFQQKGFNKPEGFKSATKE